MKLHYRTALFIYVITCVSYLAMLGQGAYLLHFMHKALPVWGLLGFVLLTCRSKQTLWLAGALGFSSLGDVLLALEFALSFIAGLSAFLVAHVFYILVIRSLGQIEPKTDTKRMALIAYFLLLSGVVVPATGALWPAVLIYTLVILTMAWCALALRPFNPMIAAGASVFVLSDSLIAINKFVMPVPFEAFLIMITYYAAQLLLVCGVITSVRGQPKPDLVN